MARNKKETHIGRSRNKRVKNMNYFIYNTIDLRHIHYFINKSRETTSKNKVKIVAMCQKYTWESSSAHGTKSGLLTFEISEIKEFHHNFCA